ncbi:hypothetical protein VTK56DRAFT_7138 [Thermocarpiscus australiensis]
MLLHPLLLSVPHLSSAAVVGSWTIQAFDRQCTPDGRACNYTLTLGTDYAAPRTGMKDGRIDHRDIGEDDDDDPAADPVTCAVTVEATPLSPLPANQTSFERDCGSGTGLRVTGTWNEVGTLVVVAVDAAQGTCASVGYRDDGDEQVSSRPPPPPPPIVGEPQQGRRRPAGRTGTEVTNWQAMKTALGMVPDKEPEIDDKTAADGPEKVGKTWQVLGLTRVVNKDVNRTEVSFVLSDSKLGKTHCLVLFPGADLEASWYGRQCGDEEHYTVSWGYAKATDSAVITVCYIPAIAWGAIAMGYVGVGLVFSSYMLVIEDSDFEAAVESLRKAGFRDAPWSYGSMCDPRSFEDDKMRKLHRRMAIGHRNLDNNSTGFLFPVDMKVEDLRVGLLRSSYTHLSLSSVPESRFSREENIYFPDKELLLESFAKTIVREPGMNTWTRKLQMWAIAYVYGQLMVNDDALDSSSDDEAKTWFDTNIRRHTGGIDRTTVTKGGRLVREGFTACSGPLDKTEAAEILHRTELQVAGRVWPPTDSLHAVDVAHMDFLASLPRPTDDRASSHGHGGDWSTGRCGPESSSGLARRCGVLGSVSGGRYRLNSELW